jgi:hypothetical protein
MHLGKVHLWIIRHQQWERTVPIFLLQTWVGRVAFIFGASTRGMESAEAESRWGD